MQGAAPLASPGLNPGRHRSRGRTTHPAGVCLRNRQLAAKPIEQPFYWRCRQPRRGGTGGDGTIRRKRRRRLRWSSPPGQIEQVPRGLAFFVACLPTLPSVYFPAPYPPDPLPRRGRGRLKVYFAGGSAPGTPALNRLRHLQNLPYKYPAAEIRGLPQNRQEAVPYEQCRQPRRGGTGGDGTIRRKRRRRLRWSSPPGQVEQMPHGERSPASPSGGTGAGAYRALAGGLLRCCLPCRRCPRRESCPPALPARPAGAVPGGGGWQAAKRENSPP